MEAFVQERSRASLTCQPLACAVAWPAVFWLLSAPVSAQLEQAWTSPAVVGHLTPQPEDPYLQCDSSPFATDYAWIGNLFRPAQNSVPVTLGAWVKAEP